MRVDAWNLRLPLDSYIAAIASLRDWLGVSAPFRVFLDELCPVLALQD